MRKLVLALMVGCCTGAWGQALQDRAAVTAAAEKDQAQTLAGLRKLIDSGRADEALTQIAAMRSKQAQMHGLHRMEGLALFAKGQIKAAEQAFAEAVAEDAGDLESRQMQGLALFQLGHPAEAIPLLEGVKGKDTVGLGVRRADPNYLLALCYIDTKRYDDARRAFAAQFGMAPESASAYLLAARMLLRREYLPIAQGFAEKAIAMEPRLPLAHALLGEIALAANHLDEAIAQFEKEREANPLEPSVYDRLGDAYGRAGRYDEARASLQEAVLLEPNATGPYILLGKTMLKQSDPLGAATYLERAAQMDPANYMTHSMLGQAYRAMGRTEDASRETATAQRLQTASEPKLSDVK